MGETPESGPTDPGSSGASLPRVVATNVQVAAEFEDRVDAGRLREVVSRTLDTETRLPAGTELTLVVSDDTQLIELNRRFRGVDGPTDVLSFEMSAADGAGAVSEDEPIYLGDVIISFPRAEAQARAAGHPTEEELDLLVVHGVLHLLGYDHETEDQKSVMWTRQEAVLGKRLID